MSDTDPNAAIFDSQQVVEEYRRLADRLTPCEAALFEAWVPRGSRVLDAGIGTGRTTARLGDGAASYVGFDISPNMIELARQRHPDADLRVLDAADLSSLEAASFDVAVFSYNGLDYLHPAAARAAALSELRRVLVPGGILLFSTHNSRAIVRRPIRRDRGHLRALAVAVVSSGRATWSLVRSGVFRRGHGYAVDSAKPLLTYFTLPELAQGELAAAGFELVETRNGDWPRKDRRLIAPWYYLVARKR